MAQFPQGHGDEGGICASRKNIKTLTAQEIASLERGVSEMKRRPKESSLSLGLPAPMHGFVRSEERVVYYGWGLASMATGGFCLGIAPISTTSRQNPAHASGDQNLTLPYWDWTKPDQLALPEPFLNPNSPLYDASRTVR